RPRPPGAHRPDGAGLLPGRRHGRPARPRLRDGRGRLVGAHPQARRLLGLAAARRPVLRGPQPAAGPRARARADAVHPRDVRALAAAVHGDRRRGLRRPPRRDGEGSRPPHGPGAAAAAGRRARPRLRAGRARRHDRAAPRPLRSPPAPGRTPGGPAPVPPAHPATARTALTTATATSRPAKAWSERSAGSRWPRAAPPTLPASMAAVKGRATVHSTAPRPRMASATAALPRTTASDVPTASGIVRCRASVRAGTTTNPPPTPKSPVRKPTRVPATSTAAARRAATCRSVRRVAVAPIAAASPRRVHDGQAVSIRWAATSTSTEKPTSSVSPSSRPLSSAPAHDPGTPTATNTAATPHRTRPARACRPAAPAAEAPTATSDVAVAAAAG